MVLNDTRHIVRGVLVWASWTLLKGTPFHNKTYGDLRRLSAKGFAKHLLTMLVAFSGALWLYFFMPNIMHGIYLGTLFIFAFSALVLVLSTFTLTWLLDRRLTYL